MGSRVTIASASATWDCTFISAKLRAADSAGPKVRAFLKDQTTFSDVLASNGYTVCRSGKWHMAGEHAQGGFSYWATVRGGGGTYKDPVFVKYG